MERALKNAAQPSLAAPRSPEFSEFMLIALAASFLALGGGYYLSLNPTWLHLDFQPSQAIHWAGFLIGAAGMFVILIRPELGLLAMVAAVYTNVSEVGVRYHHLPSVLQFIVVLVTLALLVRHLTSNHSRFVWDSSGGLLILLGGAIFCSSLSAVSPQLTDAASVEHLKSLWLFLIVVNLVTSKVVLHRTVWVLVLSGAFLGTISVYQVFTSAYGFEFAGFGQIKLAHIVGGKRQPRISGPLSDPNFYAQILVPLVPLALFRLWDESKLHLKVIAAYALSVTLLAVVFTYSRGGGLALALVLLLAAITKKVKLRYLLVSLSIIIPLLLVVPEEFEVRLGTLNQLVPGEGAPSSASDTSFQERILLTRTAWEMFSDQPLLGVGAGNYSEHYEEYSQRVGSTISSYKDFGARRFPHSLYLEIAAEMGLIGLILFGVIVALVLSKALDAVRWFRVTRDPHSAGMVYSLLLGFIGYLTTSLFLHGHYLRYLWLLVALVAAAWHIARQQMENHDS
ncbi:MAG: O-antigen ligase family protein [Acidobacteria bacterium]|nr:O-antigen ligase family protein [Acidobacteriota bacterium]